MEKVSVRTAYGVLASIVGIFCNVFLFVVKFIVGILLHSVSVTADAFNNLSDAGSSVISFIGVKMASKSADADHPFGHGRMEYIAALIVSFLILEVGFTFLKDSFGKVMHPEQLNFQLVSVLILVSVSYTHLDVYKRQLLYHYEERTTSLPIKIFASRGAYSSSFFHKIIEKICRGEWG